MQHQKPAERPGPAHLATINVRNLRLRTFIGFNPEETTKRQDVVINIEIDYAIAGHVLDDRVEDALDYKALTKAVIAHVEDGRFLLLEKLVADVLGICSTHPAVRRARVTIDKPHALRFADSVSLALEYHAGQAQQLRLLEKAS
jgi:D-erythro-7,8-dihydroneopterin triphosphate epimerase